MSSVPTSFIFIKLYRTVVNIKVNFWRWDYNWIFREDLKGFLNKWITSKKVNFGSLYLVYSTRLVKVIAGCWLLLASTVLRIKTCLVVIEMMLDHKTLLSFSVFNRFFLADWFTIADDTTFKGEFAIIFYEPVYEPVCRVDFHWKLDSLRTEDTTEQITELSLHHKVRFQYTLIIHLLFQKSLDTAKL